MSYNKLKEYQIILASASPRRQQFFREMEIVFKIHPIQVNEVYPNYLKGAEISDYLAELKAAGYNKELEAKDILITSDTVVWHNNISLAKPADLDEALSMLKTLSNDWHEVITSVCFTRKGNQQTVNHCTKVKFKELTLGEMEFIYSTLIRSTKLVATAFRIG